MNKLELNTIKFSVSVTILILTIVWGVHFVNLIYPEWHIVKFGVLPRNISGLLGIICSPLIHDTKDFTHILNNSISFFVLYTALVYFFKNIWLKISLLIWIFSGFWVWVIGRESYHIGLSGVIYGLMAFLFFSGVFRKNTNLLGLSMFVAFQYGSMVWGIFPVDPKISFEGHSGGFIVGVILASFFKSVGPKDDTYNLEVDPEFEEFVEEYNNLQNEEIRSTELDEKSNISF